MNLVLYQWKSILKSINLHFKCATWSNYGFICYNGKYLVHPTLKTPYIWWDGSWNDQASCKILAHNSIYISRKKINFSEYLFLFFFALSLLFSDFLFSVFFLFLPVWIEFSDMVYWFYITFVDFFLMTIAWCFEVGCTNALTGKMHRRHLLCKKCPTAAMCNHNVIKVSGTMWSEL